jgi:hypothetical protein
MYIYLGNHPLIDVYFVSNENYTLVQEKPVLFLTPKFSLRSENTLIIPIIPITTHTDE